jgi:hypothetical protein
MTAIQMPSMAGGKTRSCQETGARRQEFQRVLFAVIEHAAGA